MCRKKIKDKKWNKHLKNINLWKIKLNSGNVYFVVDLMVIIFFSLYDDVKFLIFANLES